MFSFHRPKVYRSSTGCCICKAKSSSSRFTDSKKYEEDFIECFKLSEPRQGEICNACVLLVKRWKKLPAGTDRNWRHVVDARAGPGMKSMTKFKSKNKNKLLCIEQQQQQQQQQQNEKLKTKTKKHFEREYSPTLSEKSDDDVDFLCEGGPSGGSSRTTSPRDSDSDEKVVNNRRHKMQPKRRQDLPQISEFLANDYWNREQICCGVIFRGQSGEIAIDLRFLKPCNARLAQCIISSNNNDDDKIKISTKDELLVENGNASPIAAGGSGVGVVGTKVFSDSSSDSGYDESSNHGVVFRTNKLLDNNIIHEQQPQQQQLQN